MIFLPELGQVPDPEPAQATSSVMPGLVYCPTEPRGHQLNQAYYNLQCQEMIYRGLAHDDQRESDDKQFALVVTPHPFWHIATSRTSKVGLSLKCMATIEAWMYLACLGHGHPAKPLMLTYTMLRLRALNPRRITLNVLDTMWKGRVPSNEGMGEIWNNSVLDQETTFNLPGLWQGLADIIRAQIPEPEPSIIHYTIP